MTFETAILLWNTSCGRPFLYADGTGQQFTAFGGAALGSGISGLRTPYPGLDEQKEKDEIHKAADFLRVWADVLDSCAGN